MAIYKRKGKKGNTYQVKVRGTDGYWITRTFQTRSEAVRYEAELCLARSGGKSTTNRAKQITLSDYFEEWFAEGAFGRTSEGWRKSQKQMFRDHVGRDFGNVKLAHVNTLLIERALKNMQQKRLSSQMQRHVYNLLHKMFEDAIERFEYLARNPAKKAIKPVVMAAETPHLSFENAKRLLAYARNRPYGVAIWLQTLAGLRAGEVVALEWNSVDLELNIIKVKATFAKREGIIRPHTKGKKRHQLRIPEELTQLLREKKPNLGSRYVTGFGNEPMDYNVYLRHLQQYCAELGLPKLGTHSLRHTSTTVYRHFGAVRDDLKALLGHSSSNDITDRYDHAKGENLRKIASVIQLFPKSGDGNSSFPKVPKSNFEEISLN